MEWVIHSSGGIGIPSKIGWNSLSIPTSIFSYQLCPSSSRTDKNSLCLKRSALFGSRLGTFAPNKSTHYIFRYSSSRFGIVWRPNLTRLLSLPQSIPTYRLKCRWVLPQSLSLYYFYVCID